MTNTIDWTEPLELEDGTPVEIVSYHLDGCRLLRRADGNWFTREQAPDGRGSPQERAMWQSDGSRFCGYPGLRVRNRAEQPAASALAGGIPDWAWDRADDLCDAENAMGNIGSTAMFALARYIAQHEQRPVDPDLVKAREICALMAEQWSWKLRAASYRNCEFDDELEVQFALSALKEARGQ